MSIYRTAVNKPVTTALLFVAFVIFGIFSMMKTSIDLFPEFDANTIVVMTAYPGASSEDVENNVTKVMENVLNGVSDLKDINSVSKENISILNLKFEYGVDINELTNDVRDKLELAKSGLPDGVSTPTIYKFGSDMMPIMMLSATAKESTPGLNKILDDKIKTPLARISGVGTVSVGGAPTRVIQVYCDPYKLQAYGITLQQLVGIIKSENRNIPSGNIDIGSNVFSLRIEKEFKDPSELLDIVVGHKNGATIYMRDLATIHDGPAEKEQESYLGGVRSAQIIIQKQNGANTVDVNNEVKAELKQIEKTLPSDIVIETLFDSSDYIINSLNSLKDTIFITFLVVILVVFLFLGRWRATFIIILTIPISLVASIMYLYASGNTLNIISMSALSIAIGMVVDDAIVALENITSHIENGEKPKEAAVHGTSEVGISIIASTLTMLCVFLPLTLVSGMTGIMFRQLGWIVSIIMIVSTLAALTLIPMLSSRFLSNKKKKGKIHQLIFSRVDKFLDKISNGYARLINWCMYHRKTVILSSVAIFVLVMGLLGKGVKTEFFPKQDQGRVKIVAELPVGTSQAISGEVAKRLYKDIEADIPEIVTGMYLFGQVDSKHAYLSMQENGAHIITINLNFGSMEDRTRSTSELADIVRKKMDKFPEITKYKITEGSGGAGSGASAVNVELYGESFELTDEYASLIQKKLLESPVFSQVVLSRGDYSPEYQVDFDRTKLAENGLNTTTAASAFSMAMSGVTASYYREDGEEYDINVRYAPEFRRSLEDIENVVIYNSRGQGIKVKELGSVSESFVPPSIERKNRQRMITISGSVATGYALSDAVLQANKTIASLQMPNELSTKIGGDYENQQEMFHDLSILMLLIVILVYMVMASQFESFMSPFVIMFSIPFAFVGVVIGLRLTDTAMSAMSMIGLIILLGIVVKNGIVLIDSTILCRERGMSIIDASTTAAGSRLRPILMTTLTTVLGMIPMAIDQGEGAAMWRPLGMTVCWGLSISTVVTLVLIPTIYCSFSTAQERRKQRKAEKA